MSTARRLLDTVWAGLPDGQYTLTLEPASHAEDLIVLPVELGTQAEISARTGHPMANATPGHHPADTRMTGVLGRHLHTFHRVQDQLGELFDGTEPVRLCMTVFPTFHRMPPLRVWHLSAWRRRVGRGEQSGLRLHPMTALEAGRHEVVLPGLGWIPTSPVSAFPLALGR